MLHRFAWTAAGTIGLLLAITGRGDGQLPRRVMPGVPPGMSADAPLGPAATDGPDLFLAHAGDLQLTDQQVVRLAAIARRASERRRVAPATMDSARSAAHADLRDALAVLTPDQQASAWEMLRRDRRRAPGPPRRD